MLFLALPFIFGKLRSTQTSKRIIIGLFIGIAFFIVSSILPNLGMILGLTPFINILIPHLIFCLCGELFIISTTRIWIKITSFCHKYLFSIYSYARIENPRAL